MQTAHILFIIGMFSLGFFSLFSYLKGRNLKNKVTTGILFLLGVLCFLSVTTFFILH